MALLRNQQPPLEERIRAVRAEAAEYIDALVEAERKRMDGGVPAAQIRRGITLNMDDLDACLYLKAREQAA